MESAPLLRQLIEYDHWANCEALTSLESLGERAERPRRIFCHVIGAQRIWLARFESPNQPSLDPWPALNAYVRALLNNFNTPNQANVERLIRNCLGLADVHHVVGALDDHSLGPQDLASEDVAAPPGERWVLLGDQHECRQVTHEHLAFQRAILTAA